MRTDHMSFNQKEQICSLYKEVFGRIKTLNEFIHEFEKNESRI